MDREAGHQLDVGLDRTAAHLSLSQFFLNRFGRAELLVSMSASAMRTLGCACAMVPDRAARHGY